MMSLFFGMLRLRQVLRSTLQKAVRGMNRNGSKLEASPANLLAARAILKAHAAMFIAKRDLSYYSKMKM